MSRDHRKLRVFTLADDLVVDVYRMTAALPIEERFGLQSQVRRAAVSAASNIVEGCARRTTKEYLNFLSIAVGSAAETQYLLTLAERLGFLKMGSCDPLGSRYSELLRGLKALIHSLEPRA